MCVIIDVPAGIQPPTWLLQDCYDGNPDGWGIMFHFNGELFSFKNTTSFQDFIQYWEATPVEVQRFIHFRIRTAGEVSPDMCHPFPFNIYDSQGTPHEFLMMHNGMLDCIELDPKKSDTWHFVRTLEGVFDGCPEFLTDPLNNVMISDASIGSKLVFLDAKGEVHKFGDWTSKYGCSFSNLYFEFNKFTSLGSAYRSPCTPQGDSWETWPDDWWEYKSTSSSSKKDEPSTVSTLGYHEVVQLIDVYAEDMDYLGVLELMQEHSISVDELSKLVTQEFSCELLQHILDSYNFTGGVK